MKGMKKSLSIFLSIVIAIMFIPITKITSNATPITADEAINWCKSQLGKTLDFDDYHGGQCVDLIYYYYAFLDVMPSGGSGYQFATNHLPTGWVRTENGIPQKGDILVYTGGLGHVAIYESENVSYHQNWSGQYVEKVNRPYNKGYKYDGNQVTYWGCIHPNFGEESKIPKGIYANVDSLDLIVGEEYKKTINFWIEGYFENPNVAIKIESNDGAMISWSSTQYSSNGELTLKGVSPGTAVLTLSLVDDKTDKVMDTYKVDICVHNKAEKPFIKGDVNGDGNITAVDARMVLQVVAGLKTNDYTMNKVADMNGDGTISAVDARIILQIVAGLK